MSTPVITAWSALSPFGTDAAAFRDAVLAAPPVPSPRAGAAGPGDLLVPGFDVKESLGKRGTRAMDKVTALAVAAVRDLLDAEPDRRERATGPGAAIVLGTTLGSAASAMRLTHDSLTQERPFFVDAARVPNAIMNCPAGQSAIWQRVQGPNTTLAGGRAAGLMGLRYSRRLLDAGRATAVLCGAVEECSPQRTLLAERSRAHRAAGAPGEPLGEGAAVFLVEDGADADPDRVLAEVLAVESGVHGPEDAADRISQCLARTLLAGGAGPDDLWAVSSVPDTDAEERALRAVLGEARPLRVPAAGARWGDAGAVTALFQIAALIEVARHDGAAGRLAAVLAVDPDGLHAAALLRMGGSR